MELSISPKDTDDWLSQHAKSPVACALETTEPWDASRRVRWWSARDEVRFPRPDEVDDPDEALAWARRAERYASELISSASVDGMFLSAVLGAFVASMIFSIDPRNRSVGLSSAAVCVAVLFCFGRELIRFGRDQYIWTRRAVALRQRADQLAAAAPSPTPPSLPDASIPPCRRWCCRLRHHPVRPPTVTAEVE